jgi:hydroxypyruvate isomerase
LINNIDRCWDEIGCIQIADNPGRCEPGTGEINFGNILTHIKQRGWSGLVEMEHGIAQPSRAGEMKVIDIYRELSEFVADATTERSYGEIGKV